MDNLRRCVAELKEYFWDKRQYGFIAEANAHHSGRGHIEGFAKSPNRTIQELILPELTRVALKHGLHLVTGTHATLTIYPHIPDGPPLMQLLKGFTVGRWVEIMWAMWPLGGELKDLRIIVDESWFDEH